MKGFSEQKHKADGIEKDLCVVRFQWSKAVRELGDLKTAKDLDLVAS